MLMTEKMVQGVDVWINTPRRPWEACGTSGMKVLVNGGLNLSELDGWWAQAYSPDVGWALGDGKEHGDDPAWDATEANALYDLLEHEIIPSFYSRDNEGIPAQWVTKIRASMAFLTPHYSANRTVREYTEQYYLPAAQRYLERAAQKGKIGEEIVRWKHQVAQNWPKIRFGQVTFEKKEEQYECQAQIYLNGLDSKDVKVELFSQDSENGNPVTHEMSMVRPLAGDPHTFIYSVTVPAGRPESEYTPRVIPFFPEVAVPLETDLIIWQK
jgi:starch phosphorylase